MSYADLQAAWARWLIDGMIAGGVRNAVVSPGSRSTPIVLALARAESDGRLESHVVIDERSAAFYALGQARATGRPSLLVCTSGTAGAHYLPAVIEAAEARVPLVVLTADRPPELRRRGASQTIDQAGMYGRFVRAEFDAGMADADPRAVDGVLRTGILAAHAASWPDPGPVHVDAPFRKPFEPDGSGGGDVGPLEDRVRSALSAGLAPPALPRVVPSDETLAAVAARLRNAGRGLVALGPASPGEAPAAATVARFAAAARFPVLAEATSQHRFGGGDFPVLDPSEPIFASAEFTARAAPDFVLQVGNAPTGRAFGAWIARSGVERIVLARHGMPEAFNQAVGMVVTDLEPALLRLAEHLEVDPPSSDEDWLHGVGELSREARSITDEVAVRPGSQGAAVRVAVAVVPEGGQLVVGNSMPVRDVDLYPPPAARGIRVLSQRGVAGIDGLVAGAAGAASSTGRPTLLLLGDVSFQHDVGSLAVAAGLDTPLVIVVVKNGGGRLFELLPVRDHAPDGLFERFFLTPPLLDVAAACEAFGVRHLRPAMEDLADDLREAIARPGTTVVEAVAPPDAAGDTARIAERLDAWLAGPEGCFGG